MGQITDSFENFLECRSSSHEKEDLSSFAERVSGFEPLLLDFLDFLITSSRKQNLVSPAPKEELIERHFVDSLAAAYVVSRNLKPEDGSLVIDIGSGAGFPGLVFAIIFPELRFMLIEPRKKRDFFLKECRRKMKLSNMSTLPKRMEEVAPDELDSPRLILCRALGFENHFLAFAAQHLVAGGHAAILAGPSWENEEKESIYGPKTLKLETIHEYQLSPQGPQRKLPVFKCFT